MGDKAKVVYVIFREGSYRHECGGVFTNKRLAKNAIAELEDQEPDKYHNWFCIPFDLDNVATTNKETHWYDFEVNEPDIIEL